MYGKLGKTLLWGALAAVMMTGCASPEEKAAKAQMRASEADLQIKQERLKLLDEYKDCLDEAGADREKADECDRILKAVEALK